MVCTREAIKLVFYHFTLNCFELLHKDKKHVLYNVNMGLSIRERYMGMLYPNYLHVQVIWVTQ